MRRICYCEVCVKSYAAVDDECLMKKETKMSETEKPKQPREFYWDGGMIVELKTSETSTLDWEWHLVEKSALDAANAEIERLKKDTPLFCIHCTFEAPPGTAVSVLQKHVQLCAHNPLVIQNLEYDKRCTEQRNKIAALEAELALFKKPGEWPDNPKAILESHNELHRTIFKLESDKAELVAALSANKKVWDFYCEFETFDGVNSDSDLLGIAIDKTNETLAKVGK